MRKLLPILLLVLIVVSGFFIYHFFKSPNSSSELNPIDTSHVQQPIEVATPSETSTIKPYIVKELSKIKSPSEVEQINHFNNQISNTAGSLEDRKKAVDRVVESAGDAAIPILLDSVKALESVASPSSESKDVKTYCLLQVSKAYEKQTNKFLSAKQPVTNDPQLTGNGTPDDSSQNISSSPQFATPAPSNANPGSTSAQDPNVTPSASANDVVPLPYSTDPDQLILKKSIDDVTKIAVTDINGFGMLSDVLLDVQKPQAVKLLAMKKACEFDKAKAIALLGQVIDLESEENDDVVKVTAVKALFDMNLPESDKILDDIQNSSKNKKVVEAIIYLNKENK